MSVLTDLIPTPYRIMLGFFLFIGLTGGCILYGKHLGDEESATVIASFQTSKVKEDDELHQLQLKLVPQIVEQYANSVNQTNDVANTNSQIIVTNIPDHEFFSKGWVAAHDATVLGLPISAIAASDNTASTITANVALDVVANNYAICKNNSSELTGLQEYITNYNNSVAKANADALTKVKKKHWWNSSK